MNLNNIYLKYLIRSHTIVGLFAIFIFYISAYFGTITLFKPYINTWQSPSKHFEVQDNVKLDLDKAILAGLKELKYPKNQVKITLPSFKEKAVTLRYGFSENIYVNPYTNEVLNTKNEDIFLSNFFNSIHIHLNIPKYGMKIMGIASFAIIFLIVSGFLLWFVSKRNAQKGFFFKWHKNISLLLLPYIIIFSLTGSVLGFMLANSSPFASSASDGKTNNTSNLIRPIIYPKLQTPEKAGELANMLSFNTLYKKAQNYEPNMKITKIVLNNWQDKNASILFQGYHKEHKILSSESNRMKLLLSATNGKLIDRYNLENSHTMSKLVSSFYFFHFIFDMELEIRILYFILGIAFCISLIFGIFIWLEKKAIKYKNEINFFTLLNKFSIALTIGVIPTSLFLLVLYWAIPFHTLDRSSWLFGGFYSFWAFCFFYCIYKKDSLESIKLFSLLSCIFLILAVVLHQVKTNTYLWDSYEKGIYSVFWIDISLLIFAFLIALFVKNIKKIKLLDKLKGL